MQAIWTSFVEALERTEHQRRHLLLGNGFSVAAHPGFSYRSLYEEGLRFDPGIHQLFDGVGVDFEAAIAAARTAEDKDRLRAVFVRAISKIHPKRGRLSSDTRERCGKFLEKFAGVARGPIRGRVFTTNYDLMLYWVIMQRQGVLKMYDGFDSYVWSDQRAWNSFVFYVHGALHLFECQVGRVKPMIEQRKLLWNENATLIDQVRQNLSDDQFPTYVSEGSSPEKVTRINRSPYLKKSRRELRKSCADEEAAIFTFGHSLASVDGHITEMLGSGVAKLYLGVFSDGDIARATELVSEWAERRHASGLPPLEVNLFRSSEAEVWYQAEVEADAR